MAENIWNAIVNLASKSTISFSLYVVFAVCGLWVRVACVVVITRVVSNTHNRWTSVNIFWGRMAKTQIKNNYLPFPCVWSTVCLLLSLQMVVKPLMGFSFSCFWSSWKNITFSSLSVGGVQTDQGYYSSFVHGKLAFVSKHLIRNPSPFCCWCSLLLLYLPKRCCFR